MRKIILIAAAVSLAGCVTTGGAVLNKGLSSPVEVRFLSTSLDREIAFSCARGETPEEAQLRATQAKAYYEAAVADGREPAEINAALVSNYDCEFVGTR